MEQRAVLVEHEGPISNARLTDRRKVGSCDDGHAVFTRETAPQAVHGPLHRRCPTPKQRLQHPRRGATGRGGPPTRAGPTDRGRRIDQGGELSEGRIDRGRAPDNRRVLLEQEKDVYVLRKYHELGAAALGLGDKLLHVRLEGPRIEIDLRGDLRLHGRHAEDGVVTVCDIFCRYR